MHWRFNPPPGWPPHPPGWTPPPGWMPDPSWPPPPPGWQFWVPAIPAGHPPAPVVAGRPWLIRWWGVLALLGTLLLGGLVGFAGTSLGLAA